MLRRGSVVSRALALSLLAAVLLAGYGFIVAPVVAAYRDSSQAIEQARSLVQRYRALGDQQPQLRERLATLEQRAAEAGGYLEGETDALAAATLQDRVRRVIERAQGRLQSTQILPASTIEGPAPVRRTALRLRLAVSIEGLQTVLYELETGQPYLFVDDLTIRQLRSRRRRNADAEAPLLDVSFEVFGYVRAAAS